MKNINDPETKQIAIPSMGIVINIFENSTQSKS
jgi:hypothetical protein